MSQTQNICNICGGNYIYRNGRWVCPCCGALKAEQMPGEEATLLYSAAQKLRLCDFDEAERAFDDIAEKFPESPDGYWGRLLARYGIKYEEDLDGRRIPTCYAASIESVLNDRDYQQALALADEDTCAYYTTQAAYIERVRQEWISRASREEPYDVFLCYKDSDLPNGIDRTPDSVAAQELYIHLTGQGYRVFFSRESLRDKTGEKYEPYIFNALSTAGVMLVYGTSADYVNSAWLKNEWSRFEKKRLRGEKKPNSLMVICDGFSPSELPGALASRQCFDATRRSFFGDLDEAIRRVLTDGPQTPPPVIPADASAAGNGRAGETAETRARVGESRQARTHERRAPRGVTLIVMIALIVALLFGGGWMIARLLRDPAVPGDGNRNVSEDGSVLTDPVSGLQLIGVEGSFRADATLTLQNVTSGPTYSRISAALSALPDADRIVEAAVWHLETDAALPGQVTVRLPLPDALADTVTALLSVYDVNDTGDVCELEATVEGDTVLVVTDRLGYLAAARFWPGEDVILLPEGTTIVGEWRFAEDTVLRECVLPDSVTSVGTAAFQGCGSLEKVYFGDRVLQIDDFAFEECRRLTGVELPPELIYIGEAAFRNCASLKSLTIPDKVQFIDHRAFEGCGELMSVTIPAGVRSIGVDAFSDCKRLKTVYYEGTIEQWRQIVFGSSQSDPQLLAEQFYVNGVPVEDRELLAVQYEDERAIPVQKGLADLVIPEGTRMIMDRQFADCPWIRSVTIPDSVVVIGGDAFQFCTGLETVTMGKNVACIEGWAFSSCPALKEINLPEGLVYLGDSAFIEDKALESVRLPDSLRILDRVTFGGCTHLQSVTVGEGVTHLGEGLFLQCEELTEVSLPASLVSIGNQAFERCFRLERLYLPASVEWVGNAAFNACSALTLECGAPRLPSGWDSAWNPDKRPVTWYAEPLT